ncbi:NAD(P)-dependent oxidoreductase [Bacillus tianshenii]|uniref:NAD-dependent epimerase/dehydratase family protein n=1 Tax=Sutcliffiella tianshenii TaxID=1463404 RepID=UPI001CD566FD|nr:NAD(P)-dependent oxidoreductase [Bacillus tianshenii]MCA1322109.1 NAD(P)-dependent oxidoreductase [Bacillus tianshenii]
MDSLKNAKVFVTGGTGYIGSCLVKRLVTEGCKVHVLTRPSSSTRALSSVMDSIQVHVSDGSYESIERAISSANSDLVFHLSSFASITYQSKDIENMITSNILIGTHLAEAMAKNGVTNLVNTSSYSQHYNQEDYHPNSLYAATKQAFEDILLYYSKASQMQVVNLVLYDNFGPHDPRPKIMNLLERARTDGKALSMSPGEQFLDLLYIDNVVDAYVVAGERLLAGSVQGMERFAVSSGRNIQLKELVSLYEQIAGGKIKVNWGQLNYRPGEIMVPWTKGISLPGWKPSISLEQGIRMFVEENRKSI